MGGSPSPLVGKNLWWNICPQPQCWATSHLFKMSQILDPNNPPIAGVVLVWPLGFQDTKNCIRHMPVMLVRPWDHLAQLSQHHHALFLSTLAPSCTKNKFFDHDFPFKTLFAALYEGFSAFSAYGEPYTWKRPDFRVGLNAQVGMAQRNKLTMKI